MNDIAVVHSLHRPADANDHGRNVSGGEPAGRIEVLREGSRSPGGLDDVTLAALVHR